MKELEKQGEDLGGEEQDKERVMRGDDVNEKRGLETVVHFTA